MREESLNIQGLQVNYKTAGEGPAVFILHGWGRGSDSWENVQVRLAQEGYKVVVPDLPGFGKTQAPPSAWGVKEYADFVLQFGEMLGLGRFILLGHSFGGQIALKFAVRHQEKIQSLILCAAAVIRRKPTPAIKVLAWITKAGNMILSVWPFSPLQPFARRILYKILGNTDYIYEKGIMKLVREKVLREDLSSFCSQVMVPTLIIWGEEDGITPLRDAHELHEVTPNSSLVVIPGVGHRVHQEVPEQLSEIILAFIKKP